MPPYEPGKMPPCWTCTCGMWPVSVNVANRCAVSTVSDCISVNVPLALSLLNDNMSAQLKDNEGGTLRSAFVKAQGDNLRSHNTSLASSALFVSVCAWTDSQCSWQTFPQIEFSLPISSCASLRKHNMTSNCWCHLCKMCWSAEEVLASLQLFFDTVIDFFFSFLSILGYITATAWLHGAFLARYTHRQPCSMHQLVRLPSGHPFLWRGL